MNLTITVENTEVTAEVKSVSAMWKKVKELFREHGNEAHILVKDENGKPFKDLTIQVKSSGKPWMINAVKETNRIVKSKRAAKESQIIVLKNPADAANESEAEETHIIDEAETKKDKKKGKKRGSIIAA